MMKAETHHRGKKTSYGSAATSALTEKDFDWISRFLYERTGITLSNKQALVMGRLDKRLRELGLDNYADYFPYWVALATKRKPRLRLIC